MTSITLTPKESELLTAVITEMKDMPQVDFEVIAGKVGIKYGKNARTGFKKVWDKLKGSGGETGAGATTAENKDSAAAETPKKAASKANKTTKKEKKGVGKTTTPRKASTGGPKTPRKTKKEKEAEVAAAAAAAVTPSSEVKSADDVDEGSQEDESEDQTHLNSFTPINGDATSVNDEDDYSEGEVNDAKLRGISVEEWRAWKTVNDYDDLSAAPTPRGYHSGSDEDA